jgi:hypothetical protein
VKHRGGEVQRRGLGVIGSKYPARDLRGGREGSREDQGHSRDGSGCDWRNRNVPGDHGRWNICNPSSGQYHVVPGRAEIYRGLDGTGLGESQTRGEDEHTMHLEFERFVKKSETFAKQEVYTEDIIKEIRKYLNYEPKNRWWYLEVFRQNLALFDVRCSVVLVLTYYNCIQTDLGRYMPDITRGTRSFEK